jgi:HK97 family phage portal protein
MSNLSELGSDVRRRLSALFRASTTHRSFEFFERHGMPPDTDQRTLVKNYTSWVYVCSSLNSTAVASTPLRLYATRSGGQRQARNFPTRKLSARDTAAIKARSGLSDFAHIKAAEDVEEILDHPALDLLKAVNVFDNAFDLKEMTSTFLDVSGNAFWYVAIGSLGIPAQIYLLRSQWVTVVPSEDDMIKGYIYGPNPETAVRFEPSEIIHFKYPNLENPFYGRGCVEAAAYAVDRQRAMDIYEKATLANMGRPDFGVVYKGRIEPSQRKRIEAEWNSSYSGPDKGGRVKVIDEDASIQNFGWSPRELAFVEGRPWTMKEICAAFNVPVALVDTKDVNKANAETAEVFHAKYGILPRLRRIEQRLNQCLAPMYDDRLFFAFDNPVPSDRKAKMIERNHNLKNAVITVNEARAADGLDPVEWGDVPLAIQTVQAAQVQPEREPPKKSATRRKDLPAVADNPEAGEGHVAPLNAAERDLAKVVSLLLANAASEASQGITEASGANDPVIDLVAFQDAAAKAVAPHLERAYESGFRSGYKQLDAMIQTQGKSKAEGDGAASGAGTGAAAGAAEAAAVAAAEVATVILAEGIDATAVIEAAKKQSLVFSQKLGGTVEAELRAALIKGIEAGESIPTIRKRVAAVNDTWKTKKKSDIIARSESARANSLGMIKQWAGSGITIKAWDAKNDSCIFCLAMHGRATDIEKSYYDVGDQMQVLDGETLRTLKFGYDVVQGPPLHPNCTCALTPVVQ